MLYDPDNNRVYIDMCNGSHAVCITKDSIKTGERPLAVFQEYSTDLPQVEFEVMDAKEVPKLLKKIVRLSEEDIVILITFMVACLFGNSKPIPIAFISGPQAAINNK